MTATPSPKSTTSKSPPRKRTWRPSTWRSKAALTRKAATSFLKASTEKRQAAAHATQPATSTPPNQAPTTAGSKPGWLTPVWEMSFIHKLRKGDPQMDTDVREGHSVDAVSAAHLHRSPGFTSTTSSCAALTGSGSTSDSFLHPHTPPRTSVPSRTSTPLPDPAEFDAVSRPRPAWTMPNGPIPEWIKIVPEDFEAHRWNMAYVVHAVGGLRWHPECGCYSCDSGAREAVDKTPQFFPGREPPRQYV